MKQVDKFIIQAILNRNKYVKLYGLNLTWRQLDLSFIINLANVRQDMQKFLTPEKFWSILWYRNQ